jgi:hypothetical protein
VSGNLPDAGIGATAVLWANEDDMLVGRMVVEEMVPAREYEGLIPEEPSSVFKRTQYILRRFNESVAISEPEQTPTLSSNQAIPLNEQMPDGWVRYAARNFELGLPAPWIASEISLDSIDASIEELRATNPDFIPYLEALKNSPTKQFWAFDTESPPGIAVNLNVGLETQQIPLEIYSQVMREQYANVGFNLVGDQEYSIGGRGVLILTIQGVAQYPGAEPIGIEVQQAIIDSADDRYIITLTYVPQLAEKYRDLFLPVVRTFRLVE